MRPEIVVGVVMPCYGQARWLPKALASIAAQGVPRQLVCVDDGSTDDTLKVLKAASGIEVLRHAENRGTAAAINTGIDQLEKSLRPKPGTIVVYSWVSSDNEMHADWLTTLVPVIAGGAGAAYGGFWKIPHPEIPPRSWRAKRPRPCLFKKHQPNLLIDTLNSYYGPAFLIRRDVWLEAGPHRGRGAHDFDHWLRVEEACWRMGMPIVGVDLPLCSYNAHDQSMSARGGESDAPHWKAVALERRAIKCQ